MIDDIYLIVADCYYYNCNMQILKDFNIQVLPITSDDFHDATKLIIESCETELPLITKGLQSLEVLESKTLQMFPHILKAEDEFNSINGTNVFFSAKYVQNQKILGVYLITDLLLFIKILKSGKPELYYRPVQNLDNGNLGVGTDYYSGKLMVSKEMMKHGLARAMIIERMNYLYSCGYKRFHSVIINPSIYKFAKSIGCFPIDKAIMEDDNGKITEFPLITGVLQTTLRMTEPLRGRL